MPAREGSALPPSTHLRDDGAGGVCVFSPALLAQLCCDPYGHSAAGRPLAAIAFPPSSHRSCVVTWKIKNLGILMLENTGTGIGLIS